jgi:hypothetical protein
MRKDQLLLRQRDLWRHADISGSLKHGQPRTLYTITLAIPSALVAFSLVNAELRMSARSETRRGYATAWQMVLALRRL